MNLNPAGVIDGMKLMRDNDVMYAEANDLRELGVSVDPSFGPTRPVAITVPALREACGRYLAEMESLAAHLAAAKAAVEGEDADDADPAAATEPVAVGDAKWSSN